jgi:hypothetical protein
MKTETENLRAKLLSKDPKIQQETIVQMAKSDDIKQLEFMMNVLLEKRIGNGLSNAIKTIGNSENEIGQKILIAIYGSAKDNDKKLIIAALLKLGAFKNFFPGNQQSKNIAEQLWPLLFGLNSTQLENILSLGEAEFKNKLDFARKTTKHWRK